MKEIFKKIRKIKSLKLLVLIDLILSHYLFKPIAISIIVSFFVVQGFKILQDFVSSYNYASDLKKKATSIKINILKSKNGVDIYEEQILDYQVKKGDTFLKILLDLGVSEADAFSILEATKKVYNPKLINNKSSLTIKYKAKVDYEDESGSLEDVKKDVLVIDIEISLSPELEIKVFRKEDGTYESKEIKLALTKNVTKYYGELNSGLFVDGVQAGISPTAMMNMINLYSYDVDFQRDIKKGDKFEMVVESFYTKEGKKVKDGKILFTSLVIQGKPIEIYMHLVNNKPEYFDAKGNSVRKSLLKTPINGARVSSGFGVRRHPILGYSRMHKGIDFAAPSGTPIFAAGSGTITYYSVKGGYGNFVQIKHNSDYSTAYGHASRFVKKLSVGSKVKQGDVVAYVGSTGRSTGPHLHFEVIYKGMAINPAKVKATSGSRLGGKELSRFKAAKEEIDRYRKNVPNQIKS